MILAAEKAFQRVFKKGYKPEDLFKQKEFADLVTETKAAFDPAIKFVQSDVLKSYLDRDAFIFSGLKAHRLLTQARSLLKDDKGNIRPYHQFEQEITKLNNTYNKLYLEAEYAFAIQSAQSADQWSNLSDDTDRYWLQYRTAKDERVREDHEALAGTTLPKDDPFWDSYYPPNGWRCRCVAVEVLARKNKRSDSKEAIKKGETATTQINKAGANKLAMFRFNPGKQQKLFPPKNSYMPRGCGGTLSITDAVFLALDDEACRAKKIIEDKVRKIQRKAKDREIKIWVQKNVPEGGTITKNNNFKTGKVAIYRSKLRSINDHLTELQLKELTKDIDVIIKKAQYVKSAPLNPRKGNYQRKLDQGVVSFNYYKLVHKGFKLQLNCEVIDGMDCPYAINVIE